MKSPKFSTRSPTCSSFRARISFALRAYHNAARAIHDQLVQVAELTPEQIDDIPGIGADLAGKITKMIQTGDLPLHRELARKFPHELLELREIPGLGPKRIKLLMDRLHIHGKEDLERHAKSGKLHSIKGFGPKIEEKILETIARNEPGSGKRILYSRSRDHHHGAARAFAQMPRD